MMAIVPVILILSFMHMRRVRARKQRSDARRNAARMDEWFLDKGVENLWHWLAFFLALGIGLAARAVGRAFRRQLGRGRLLSRRAGGHAADRRAGFILGLSASRRGRAARRHHSGGNIMRRTILLASLLARRRAARCRRLRAPTNAAASRATRSCRRARRRSISTTRRTASASSRSTRTSFRNASPSRSARPT